MNILALDTSAQSLLVSVKTDTYYEENTSESPEFKHSERLMNVILEMLERAKLKTTDIDLFVCTRGPGSFTGLRIGMATLKGMAYGCSKPLVSVSTLEMWAHTVQHFDGKVISAIDAKKERYYLSVFDCKEGSTKRLIEDIDGNIENIEALLKNDDNILVVGPDKLSFSEILKSKYCNVSTEAEQTISVSQSLIELAIKQYNEKGPDDVGQGPLYIRKSDAEVALEEKQKLEGIGGR